MTELEYQEHIQYTHKAFCKIAIRHAAIDMALRLRKRWEKEISLDNPVRAINKPLCNGVLEGLDFRKNTVLKLMDTVTDALKTFFDRLMSSLQL